MIIISCVCAGHGRVGTSENSLWGSDLSFQPEGSKDGTQISSCLVTVSPSEPSWLPGPVLLFIENRVVDQGIVSLLESLSHCSRANPSLVLAGKHQSVSTVNG